MNDATVGLIFVVGAPRSGTTLTAQILGRHPDVLAPGETHYFEEIWARRNTFGNLQSDEQLRAAVRHLITLFGHHNFLEAQALVDAVIDSNRLVEKTKGLGGGNAALYDCFTQALMQSAGKRRFCDDTPKHLYYLPVIFDLFPRAQAIICIRDPRDFLASYKNYWRKSLESERVRALYHPLITSLQWRSAANLALGYSQRYGKERITFLRYEKLVGQPEVEVERLCRFLDLHYSEDLILIQSHNSSFARGASGIFTSSVGRWRSALEPEEVWWNQAITRDKLQALGYKTEPVRASSILLLRAFLQTPFALFRALRVNARKRGPLLGYLWRRVIALASPR